MIKLLSLTLSNWNENRILQPDEVMYEFGVMPETFDEMEQLRNKVEAEDGGKYKALFNYQDLTRQTKPDEKPVKQLKVG